LSGRKVIMGFMQPIAQVAFSMTWDT